MLYFDVIFRANSSVKPLNANSDKMIFAVSMEDQTFIRYVAADGTSMILQSFDYKANFVNASLSFDFRLLHLTELVYEDGNYYYSSVIYDVQNSAVKSYPIHSSEIIKGDFQSIDQYNIIYLIRGKMSQHILTIQDDSIILSKDVINSKIKHVIWSQYSLSKDILSVLTKSGDRFSYCYNLINSDTFYNVKYIDENNQNWNNFYSANYHEVFCLFQQCFLENSDHDQIQVHFFPQDKYLSINVPKASTKITMNCFQYYSVVFIFVPNLYICIVDMKSMNYIVFDNYYSKMPVSKMITAYDEGILCDNKEGIIYSVRIDLNSLKCLCNDNEIKAIAIIGARIKCSNYIYIAPKEKNLELNSDNKRSIKSPKNRNTNEKDKKSGNMNEFNEFLSSTNFESNKKDSSGMKRHSDSEDVLKTSSAKNLFREVNDDDYIDDNDSDDDSINQKKSGNLMDYDDSQKNVAFKKSFSFDLNLHKDKLPLLENLSIQYQIMYGKIIIEKNVVYNIFNFLVSPRQISLFIKEFIKLNGIGSSDRPISALSIFYKRPYILPVRLSPELKKELIQMDKFFPTTGLMNRCDVFTRFSKMLFESRSLLSFAETFKEAMDVIRRQNSFMINLKEAFLMWQVKGSIFKFRKFLVTFCLYSELSFLNLPQIIEIRQIILKYSKKYFSKTIQEMMMIFGLYGSQSSDFNIDDLKYWKNRINIQAISSTHSKPPSGKKQKEKKLINTFTVPYFKIRNQRVFRVHHYSHIP